MGASVNNSLDKSKPLNLSTSPIMRGALVFCFLVGAASVAAGMMTDTTRTWGALLFNFFFFFMISLIAMAFAAMQEIVVAKWTRPIKRLHEAFGCFLPIAGAFFIIFLIFVYFKIAGAHEVYLWIKDPHVLDHFHGKDIWLQPGFMVIRNIVCVVIILLLALWQFRSVLNSDEAALKKNAGFKDQISKTYLSLRHWAAPVCLLYALCFSILCFDLLMSLAPTWFSTLWAGWLFAMGMQLLFASLSLLMFFLKSTPIGNYYSTQQFHDVGKLLYGFTIFFAYLTYAHVLTYWYGNMPEFTEYFIHRLHKPWIYIVMIAPVFNFLIPLFALIPKAAKYTPVYTQVICIFILVAQWFAMMLVVMPEVVDVKTGFIPFIELGILIGVFGLFVRSILWFGARYSMISLGDPLWVDSNNSH